MKDVTAYWNGDWVPQSSLSIGLNDLGFTMGVTVVERLRTFNHQPYRIEQHIARLRNSLEIVGWNPTLAKEVRTAIEKFAAKNADLMQSGDDWSICAFITPGKSHDAASPNVCVHGNPLPFANWAEQYETGVAAEIVDVRQLDANNLPPQLKCRSRMHYYLADREAEQCTSGARAILLDQDGNIGEGTTANVIAYFEDRGLVTPRHKNVLPGISQDALFEIANQLDIACEEADLSPAEFANADEIYFASTSICLLPVVRLSGKPVGSGKVGATLNKLLEAWGESVGVDLARQALAFSKR
ncbi:aminotransferase class IV [Adhaeretor mobilis]|uniref:branched-chain-amino-acid transaminase n=1 Tax=Adhaeretor mobilis TaxID=1930276 RepID=A0A517MT92_9BACT|nr:aminotransferase class IV [Adhaeretor mobilis]QDS98104.1 putative branched-chain-amino-acid aminotransferase [Adhaeretor mobilis]